MRPVVCRDCRLVNWLPRDRCFGCGRVLDVSPGDVIACSPMGSGSVMAGYAVDAPCLSIRACMATYLER